MKDHPNKPPMLAQWLLRLTARNDEQFAVLGDYEEEFEEMSGNGELHQARRWYWRQALDSALPFIINRMIWRFDMFQNYFKIALRNIRKHKVYSFINVTGLAIGMTCCILLVLYIHAELSFDRYHKYADRIYRLCAYVNIGGNENYNTSSNALCAGALKDDYPEVVNAVRMRWMYASWIRFGEKRFFENSMFYADESVFDIFS